MKNYSILAGFGLAMLAFSVQAQDGTPALPKVRKAHSTESTFMYRLGRQGVSLGGLNQVLQQTGYPDLSNQFTVFGFTNESSRLNEHWVVFSQFDFALKSASQSISNGTNSVRVGYFQYGIGAGYRIVRTEKFALMPRLMFSPAMMLLNVTRNNAPVPSVASILTNPAAQQTATLINGSIAGDLGLSGQYRFVYGTTTASTDCGAITRERSLVLGIDAGYRISPTTSFNQSASDAAVNPTVNLSGWYVAARVGFGRRYSR